MEAVCTLLEEPVDWESARSLLSGTTFVNSLIKFDKDSVNDKTLAKLAKFVLRRAAPCRSAVAV